MLAQWMKSVPDDTPLAAMTIPGTHNSCARFGGFWPVLSSFTKCQDMTLPEQFAAGIRYVDIRVRPMKGDLRAVHKDVDQEISFSEIVGQAFAFLSAHPSETVIMQVSCEGPADMAEFLRLFEQDYRSVANAWYKGNWFPRLGEARGRIILVKRFTSEHPGISVTWQNDTTFKSGSRAVIGGTERNVSICIQDCYSESDANKKWPLVANLLREAERGDLEDMYLNFLSANRFPTTPYALAERMNARLHDAVVGGGEARLPKDARLGVLIMDYPRCTLEDDERKFQVFMQDIVSHNPPG